MAGAAGNNTINPMQQTTGTVAPVNPMQQASLAQQGALAGTVGAGTVAGANLNQYMNPYTQNVIGGLQTEAQRAMQLGTNQLGAQATRAGAYGGSRQAVAQGQMMADVQRNLNQQVGQMQMANYANAQAQAQQDITNRMQQAAQLSGLGKTSFDYGQQIQSGLAQQGAQQQAIQQALIDAAKGQYAGYTGAPAMSLGYANAAIGGTPTPQTQTTSRQPGLFDYLTLAATAMPR
jgi:hypothetical protein